jgi:hypothetical protein
MIAWIPTLTLLSPLAPAANQPLGPDHHQAGTLDLTKHVEALDDLRVGGLLRAYYDYADDELGTSGDNISGVRLYDAQVWVNAEAHGFRLFVRMDAAEASAFPPIDGSGVGDLFELRDAYVEKGITEEFTFYLGQFKCPLVASGNVGDGNLSMIERTRIGQIFSAPGAYQPGIAVTYDGGPFHGKVVLQNGADNATDGNGIVVRGEYRLGDTPHNEGALEAADGFNATFGAGWFQDDSDIAGEDFGSAWAVDVYATVDALSLHAEILGADEELASRALGNTTEDAMPYSATVGFRFHEQWEGFVRYQDLDNEADATILGAGVNHYVAGHLAKWQLNVSQYDDDAIDGLIVQAGLSLGLSQPHRH